MDISVLGGHGLLEDGISAMFRQKTLEDKQAHVIARDNPEAQLLKFRV